MAYNKDVVSEATPNYASEIKYINDRLDLIHQRRREDKRMFRLLVRLLVDKKVIGEEIAKTFEETQSNKELLEWFLKNNENEEGK